MATPITIPRLGWNMDEGVFQGWIKQDGDTIALDDPLFTLEGEKATEEIVSLSRGTLRVLPGGPKPGDMIAVGTVIGHLVGESEAVPGMVMPARADEAKPALSTPIAGKDNSAPNRLVRSETMKKAPALNSPPLGKGGLAGSSEPERMSDSQGNSEEGSRGNSSPDRAVASDPPSPPLPRGGEKRISRLNRKVPMLEGEDPSYRTPLEPQRPEGLEPVASPRARRLAGELGVDWTKLKGSGSTGRIRERDVRAFASVSQAAIGRTTRRRIAQRLRESLRTTVPVTLTTTADATHLVHLYRQFQVVDKSAGTPAPSYTDFLVKLVAGALQQHPQLNAHTDGERTVVCSSIHIGVAVDTDNGLLVPVIRDAATLSFRELASRSRDLITRARENTLKATEMQEGTFTVSNLGGFGIDAFTPILNPPQIAILGVGRIQRRPAVRGDQIVAREEITLSLTFDHCSVDGAPAARFLQTLRERVENPGPWLIP
ncbi:MAG TPA: dihydrolipoamide acetyltransferase family protein [Gemmataceae bacterium]|nr:dihydrolipoamide acetyltransferase family protein [Gemmataceae bacterium]